MSDTVALLQAALQQLAPEHLEIHDDSAAHAGHAARVRAAVTTMS
jgi:BolA protein